MTKLIIQLSNKPINEDQYVDKDSIYKEMFSIIDLDYVYQNESLSTIGVRDYIENQDSSYIEFNADNNQIIFKKGYKDNYFKPHTNNFLALADKLKKDASLIKDLPFHIAVESCLSFKLGFYIHFLSDSYASLDPEDDFVLDELQEEVAYYIGQVSGYN